VKFNNLAKIRSVKAPVFLVHGMNDTLIPPSHSKILYDSFEGRKEILLIDNGQHNDLHSFQEFKSFIASTLPTFFFATQRYRLSDN
jgi:uncharacterized protein